MTGRPRRNNGNRRATTNLVYRAPRRPALPPGQLQALVLAHLKAHPRQDFGPGDLARILDRSHGAIAAACQRLTALGQARCTQPAPRRRYRAATPPPTPPTTSAAPPPTRGPAPMFDRHEGTTL
jgi:hypothetical protein